MREARAALLVSPALVIGESNIGRPLDAIRQVVNLTGVRDACGPVSLGTDVWAKLAGEFNARSIRAVDQRAAEFTAGP